MKWRDSDRGRLATEASDLSSNGHHDLALSLLEQALQINPLDPLVLVYHGRVLHALGRDSDSERSFRKAISIKCDLSFAWSEFGMMLIDCKRLTEAAECLKQSAAIRPDCSTYTLLASIKLAFDADGALRDATSALELDPTWDEAIHLQALAERAISKRNT